MPPTNHHEPRPVTGPEAQHPGTPELLLPGEPPVRVTLMRTATLHDPPPDSGIFTGLAPRLAATLLATYTSPGDVIVDTTADLALEGTARAGGRDCHHLTLPAEPPPPHTGSRPPPASLVLLHWPDTATTGGSSGGAGRGASWRVSVDALERALRAGQELACPDGHLILVQSRPGDIDYRDHAHHLILAARAAEVGSVHHVVVVTAPGPRGSHAVSSSTVAATARADLVGGHVRQLVFVLSATRSRHHE